MKLKKLLSALITGIIFTSTGIQAVKTFAYSEVKTGLIEKCSVSCTQDGDGKIKITAKTQVSGEMDEIGYLDIKVQYSDDCENWNDELSIKNIQNYNTDYFIINGLSQDVNGGYYYRVTCTHHAKGQLFNTNTTVVQNTENASKPVWVDKSNSITSDYLDSPVTTTFSVSTSSTTSTSTTSTVPVTSTVLSSSTKNTSSTSISTQNNSNNSSSSTNNNPSTVTTAYTQNKDNSPNTGVLYPFGAVTALLSGMIVMLKFRKKN